jgi:hypothetical protein
VNSRKQPKKTTKPQCKTTINKGFICNFLLLYYLSPYNEYNLNIEKMLEETNDNLQEQMEM